MHFKPPFLNREFLIKASRSGGKGGQNVNKVSTKVQLEFSVKDSQLLTEEEKQTILDKLAAKINNEGLLQVVSQTERTQLGNKEITFKKIYALLNKCFVVGKKRKATKPSKAAQEKRINTKKKQGLLKKERTKKPSRSDYE